MSLWYLRRGVPWAPLLGCLGLAALLMPVARHSQNMDGLAMLLAALLVAASAAFVYDEPALEVAAVAPRARWAVLLRTAVFALPLLGFVVLGAGQHRFDLRDWSLFVALLGTGALLGSWEGRGRGNARPGALVAPLVVFVGLTPAVLEEFLGLSSPYPTPAYSAAERVRWSLVLGIALLMLVARLIPRTGHKA